MGRIGGGARRTSPRGRPIPIDDEEDVANAHNLVAMAYDPDAVDATPIMDDIPMAIPRPEQPPIPRSMGEWTAKDVRDYQKMKKARYTRQKNDLAKLEADELARPEYYENAKGGPGSKGLTWYGTSQASQDKQREDARKLEETRRKQRERNQRRKEKMQETRLEDLEPHASDETLKEVERLRTLAEIRKKRELESKREEAAKRRGILPPSPPAPPAPSVPVTPNQLSNYGRFGLNTEAEQEARKYLRDLRAYEAEVRRRFNEGEIFMPLPGT
eukprot:jgi/Mesvir1/11147/Mv04589-RA.1